MSDQTVNLSDQLSVVIRLREAMEQARTMLAPVPGELADPKEIDGQTAAWFFILARAAQAVAEELAEDLRHASDSAWVHTSEAQMEKIYDDNERRMAELEEGKP